MKDPLRNRVIVVSARKDMKIRNRPVLVALFAVASILCGCDSRPDQKINQIKAGMSDFDVLRIMGIPDKVRTEYKAMQLGPLGTAKLFMYKGGKNWHRILIVGRVIDVHSTADGTENRQFPIKMEIMKTGQGEYEYKIGGHVKL